MFQAIIAVLRFHIRVIAVVLVVPVWALLWGFAPEHAHQDSSEGHGIVHRHIEPHHDVKATAPHDGAEFADHSDEDAVWIDAVGVQEAPIQAPRSALGLVEQFTRPLAGRARFPKRQDHGAPVHGPPRSSLAYRGPPPSCLI